MAKLKPWDKIENDPEFQALPLQEKGRVRAGYWRAWQQRNPGIGEAPGTEPAYRAMKERILNPLPPKPSGLVATTAEAVLGFIPPAVRMEAAKRFPGIVPPPAAGESALIGGRAGEVAYQLGRVFDIAAAPSPLGELGKVSMAREARRAARKTTRPAAAEAPRVPPATPEITPPPIETPPVRPPFQERRAARMSEVEARARGWTDNWLEEAQTRWSAPAKEARPRSPEGRKDAWLQAKGKQAEGEAQRIKARGGDLTPEQRQRKLIAQDIAAEQKKALPPPLMEKAEAKRQSLQGGLDTQAQAALEEEAARVNRYLEARRAGLKKASEAATQGVAQGEARRIEESAQRAQAGRQAGLQAAGDVSNFLGEMPTAEELARTEAALQEIARIKAEEEGFLASLNRATERRRQEDLSRVGQRVALSRRLDEQELPREASQLQQEILSQRAQGAQEMGQEAARKAQGTLSKPIPAPPILNALSRGPEGGFTPPPLSPAPTPFAPPAIPTGSAPVNPIPAGTPRVVAQAIEQYEAAVKSGNPLGIERAQMNLEDAIDKHNRLGRLKPGHRDVQISAAGEVEIAPAESLKEMRARSISGYGIRLRGERIEYIPPAKARNLERKITVEIRDLLRGPETPTKYDRLFRLQEERALATELAQGSPRLPRPGRVRSTGLRPPLPGEIPESIWAANAGTVEERIRQLADVEMTPEEIRSNLEREGWGWGRGSKMSPAQKLKRIVQVLGQASVKLPGKKLPPRRAKKIAPPPFEVAPAQGVVGAGIESPIIPVSPSPTAALPAEIIPEKAVGGVPASPGPPSGVGPKAKGKAPKDSEGSGVFPSFMTQPFHRQVMLPQDMEGWWTNGHVLVKGKPPKYMEAPDPELRPQARKLLDEAIQGNKNGIEAQEITMTIPDNPGKEKISAAILTGPQGEQTLVDARYIGLFKGEYPNARFIFNSESNQILVIDGQEDVPVGLILGLHGKGLSGDLPQFSTPIPAPIGKPSPGAPPSRVGPPTPKTVVGKTVEEALEKAIREAPRETETVAGLRREYKKSPLTERKQEIAQQIAALPDHPGFVTLQASPGEPPWTYRILNTQEALTEFKRRLKGSGVILREQEASFGETPGSPLLTPLQNQRGSLLFPFGAKGPQYPKGSALRELEDMIGTPGAKERGSLATAARRQLTDRFAPLEVWERAVRGIRDWKQAPVEKSPYRLARLYAGRMGLIQNSYDELRKILLPLRSQAHDFELYWLARRSEERVLRGIGTGGMDLARVQASLDELRGKYGDAGLQAFEAKIDELVAWSDRRILRPMLDTGLLSPEAYKAIRTNNQKWAPFDVIHHLPDDVERFSPGGELFSVARQDVVRAMTGMSEGSQIRSLFDALANRVPTAISTIERQRVAKALLEMRADFPELNDLFIPAGKGAAPKGWGTLSVFENGQATKYLVPEFLEDAMKQLSPEQLGLVSKVVGLSSAAFRRGATSLYAPFVVRNSFPFLGRDYKYAKMMSTHGFNIVDWMHGFGAGLKASFGFDSPLYTQVLEGKGGFSGWVQHAKGVKESSRGFFRPRWKIVGRKLINPLELVDAISQAGELAPRLGLARKTLKRGEGILEAGWDARTGTIDFSKGGTLLKAWNLYVPFFNARVQGTAGLLNTLARRPAHAAGVALTYSVLPGLAFYLWNHREHPDKVDLIPDEMWDNHFPIITGEGFDERTRRKVPQVLLIPKGDTDRFFWNPIETVLRYVSQEDPESIGKLALNFFSDLSPVEIAREGELSLLRAASQLVPPLVRAPLEVATNKDWYRGTPVVPRRLEGVAPKLQSLESTPEIVQRLGQVTSRVGISPLELQHLAGGLFGGTARQVTTDPRELLAKSFYRPAGGAIEQRSYKVIDDAMIKYNSLRQEAINRIQAGEGLDKVIPQILAWNQEAKGYVERLRKLGWVAGKFERTITFQKQDVKNLVRQALQEAQGIPPLERRLNR